MFQQLSKRRVPLHFDGSLNISEEIVCESYFAWDFGSSDSSRRQIESPDAPRANIPSVTRWGAGAVRDTFGPSISSGPFVLPVIIDLLAMVS
jgi:hypothetical protein